MAGRIKHFLITLLILSLMCKWLMQVIKNEKNGIKHLKFYKIILEFFD